MEYLRFVVALFQVPAVILGTIALIGLIAQRSSLGDIISGTVKTILSVLIIAGGVTVLLAALVPIQTMFEKALPSGSLTTFVTFDEAVVSAVQTADVARLGLIIGLTLLFGYIVHLILARVTPFHYVYLTGHMIWIHAGGFAILFYSLGFSLFWNVALASLVDGIYMTLAPALAQPFMRKITGGDDVAFGHGQTLLNVFVGYVGMLIGNPKHSTEDYNLPEKLNFFRDIAVSTTIVMFLVSFAAGIAARIEIGAAAFSKDISLGQNWAVFCLLMAFGFTAGMLILLYGVRMLISEIVPAFQGISERLIPKAIPALDVPVIFPFAPNALLVGLISGLIGQVVGMVALAAIGWPVPIPSMIVAFFASGAGAIFANSTGGRRGAWVGGFLWGLIAWFIISFAYKFQVFGDLTALGAPALGFTVPDLLVPAIIIHLIAGVFGF